MRTALMLTATLACILALACGKVDTTRPATPAPTLPAFALSTPATISTPVLTDPAALVLTPLPTLTPVAAGRPEAPDTHGSAAVVATRDPASWTEYDISVDVIAQLREFVIAASAQPAPDYQRALVTFAHACRQDVDAFTKSLS